MVESVTSIVDSPVDLYIIVSVKLIVVIRCTVQPVLSKHLLDKQNVLA